MRRSFLGNESWSVFAFLTESLDSQKEIIDESKMDHCGPHSAGPTLHHVWRGRRGRSSLPPRTLRQSTHALLRTKLPDRLPGACLSADWLRERRLRGSRTIGLKSTWTHSRRPEQLCLFRPVFFIREARGTDTGAECPFLTSLCATAGFCAAVSFDAVNFCDESVLGSRASSALTMKIEAGRLSAEVGR